MTPALPPTSARLLDPAAVPYFLYDVGWTVGDAHAIAASDDREKKDELVVRLLREANSRDVWLFVDWDTILDAWPRVEHRLGRSRAAWRMMIDHQRRRRGAPASP